MHSDQSLADPEVLTLTEVAEFLRVSEAVVLELINQGAFPAQFIGSEWRLLKDAVVTFLETFPDRSLVQPGSKNAVLSHFGVFQDDDIQEQLANVRAGRGADEA